MVPRSSCVCSPSEARRSVLLTIFPLATSSTSPRVKRLCLPEMTTFLRYVKMSTFVLYSVDFTYGKRMKQLETTPPDISLTFPDVIFPLHILLSTPGRASHACLWFSRICRQPPGTVHGARSRQRRQRWTTTTAAAAVRVPPLLRNYGCGPCVCRILCLLRVYQG